MHRNNQSSIKILFFRWFLHRWCLFVELHYVFHDDFFLVEDIITLHSAWHFATVQVEIIMEIDSVGKALTFMLLELICSALPPEMAVGFVREGNLPHGVRQGVFMAEGVSSESQVFIVFEWIGQNCYRLVFRLSLNRRHQNDRTNHS